VIAPENIVLFSPGLKDDTTIWGERIAVINESKYLKHEFPGSRIFAFDIDDRDRIARMPVDLLISYYTGPKPPWRCDDIALSVSGVTILKIVNHGDLIDEFARIPVDS
jgi:hypothetical protein